MATRKEAGADDIHWLTCNWSRVYVQIPTLKTKATLKLELRLNRYVRQAPYTEGYAASSSSSSTSSTSSTSRSSSGMVNLKSPVSDHPLAELLWQILDSVCWFFLFSAGMLIFYFVFCLLTAMVIGFWLPRNWRKRKGKDKYGKFC